MIRLSFVFLASALALGGCAGQSSGRQAQADAQTRMACEKRAEQVYEEQNRKDIFGPASSVNTPFASNYVVGDTTLGLPGLFAHDRMVSDCVNNSSARSGGPPPSADN